MVSWTLSHGLLFLVVCIFTIGVVDAKPHYNRFQLINDFFEDRQLGRFTPNIPPRPTGFRGYPGPCKSSHPDDECKVNFGELPASLKNVVVNLAVLGVTSPPTRTLAEILGTGSVQIHYLQISDIEVDSVTSPSSFYNETHASFDIQVKGVAFEAIADFRLNNIKVGPTSITIRGTLPIKKTKQVLQGKNDVSFVMVLESPEGLANAVPSKLHFPVESCQANLHLGIELSNVSPNEFDLTFGGVFNVEAFADQANGIVEIMTPMVGAIVCQIVSQLGTLNSGEVGFLGELLKELTDLIEEWGYKSQPNPDTADAEAYSALTDDQKEEAQDFQNSVIVGLLDTTINGWLGAESTRTDPKYAGKLVVNEAIDLLTDDTGSFEVSDLAAAGLKFTLPLYFANMSLSLFNISFEGANTFQVFQAIQYVNPQNHYSLNHSFQLGEVHALAGIEVKLSDGTWEQEGPHPPEVIVVVYDVAALNISITLSTLTAVASSELLDRQLGQLLGGAVATTLVDQAIYSFKCLSPALYNITLSSLLVGVDGLATPVAIGFPDSGYGDLINNLTEAGIAALEAGIKSDLPTIAQHFVRPRINDMIRRIIVEEADECIPFVPASNTPKYFDFSESNAFLTLSKIVNQVVGGNPVIDNSVDINQILDMWVQFAADFYDWTYLHPSEGSFTFSPDLRFIRNGPPTEVTGYMAITKFVIQDGNSVLTLLLDPTSTHGFTFNFTIGDGFVTNADTGLPEHRNPIQLTFTTDLEVKYPTGHPRHGQNIRSLVDLSVGLHKFDVDFSAFLKLDMNTLFRLKLSELRRFKCILASLDDGLIGISSHIEGLDFTITIHPESLVGTNLNNALLVLKGELDNPVNDVQFNAMMDYIFASVGNGIAGIINNYDFASVENTILTCHEYAPSVSDVILLGLETLLSGNVTELITKYTGPQPAVLSIDDIEDMIVFPSGAENRPFLDWDDHFLGRIVSVAVGKITNEKFVNFLSQIGNTTDDCLHIAFQPEADDNFTLRADLTAFPPLPLDGLIDGGEIRGVSMNITNFNHINFDNMKILYPLSDFVTQHHVEVPGDKHIDFDIQFVVPAAFLGQSGANKIENVRISFDIGDILFDGLTLIAVNNKTLSELSLGHFIHVDSNQQFSLKPELTSCFWNLFFEDGFQIPQLELSVGKFENLAITVEAPNKFISNGLVGVIREFAVAIADLILQDLKYITQGMVRTFLNDYVLIPFVRNPGKCFKPPRPNLEGDDEVLNYQVSNFASTLHELTSGCLAGKDGKYKTMNGVINAMINTAYLFNNYIGLRDFLATYKSVPFGNMTLLIGKFNLKNLGSFSDFSLMNPTAAYSTLTNFTIAGPIVLTFELHFQVKDYFVGGDIQDDLKFSVSTSGFDFGLDLVMQINIPKMMEIQAGAFFNVTQLPCIMRAIQKFSIANFHLTIEKLFAEMECIGTCNSPRLSGLANGGKIDTGDSESLANLATALAEFAAGYVSSPDFQDVVNNQVSSADQNCALALDLSQITDILKVVPKTLLDVGAIFGLGFIGGLAGGLSILVLTIPRHFQKKRRYLEEAHIHYRNEPGATQESVAAAMAKEEVHMLAIANHPAVPLYAKFLVPIGLLVNLANLFLCIYLLPSFTVDVYFTIAGSKTKDLVLVYFSIRSTINDMWNSGAVPVALLIAGASCAWPIIKNLILGYYWFAPTTILGKDTKAFGLEVLDLLGKWSMLDIYVVIVVVSALRFSVSMSMAANFAFVPEDMLKVDFTATPENGIILLSIAAICSLIINHIIIYWNERAKFADKRLFNRLDGIPDDMLSSKTKIRMKLSDYVFSTTNKFGQHDRFGVKGKNLVTMALAFGFLLGIIIFVCPLFAFNYDGLAGIAFGFIDPALKRREFTLLSCGMIMAQASKGTVESWITVIFFQIMYYLTVILAPLLQLGLFAFVWLRPMNYFEAETTIMWANIAGYWASIEVFMVSLIATAIEIPQVTTFMLDFITGGICSNAKSTLVELVGEKDGSCLNIYLSPEFVFWAGVPYAIIAAVINGIALRACRIAQRDRKFVLEHHPMEDRLKYTFLEFKVAEQLFPNGADHHLPPKDLSKPRLVKEKKVKEKPKVSKWNAAAPVMIPQQQFFAAPAHGSMMMMPGGQTTSMIMPGNQMDMMMQMQMQQQMQQQQQPGGLVGPPPGLLSGTFQPIPSRTYDPNVRDSII